MGKRTCVGPDCDYEAMPKGDVCKSHWWQRKHHPDRPLRPLRRYSPKGGFTICAFPDCGRRAHSGGDCSGHRKQRVQGKTLTPLKKIAAKGADQGDCPCGEKAEISGFCKKCYYSKYQRQWRNNNKEKILTYVHRRRARFTGGDDGTVTTEVMQAIREMDCVACGAPGPSEVDHIIPLAHVSGLGLHTADNLQPMCRWCNASKGAKSMDEWMATRRSA